MARQLKTARMLLLEAKDAKKRSIQEIMVDLYQERGSMRAAAEALNVTVTTFSDWVYRLNINLPNLREQS